MSHSSLEDLKVPEIKKILRGCEVDPTDILAAKTRMELLELARFNGIVEVPDEWTIAKIKQQRMKAKEKAMAASNAPATDALVPSAPGGKGMASKAMSFFSRREATLRWATSRRHVLVGEERIAVRWDARTDAVTFSVLSFSRPRHLVSAVSYPLVLLQQRRFARDAGRVMVRAGADG